MDGSLRLNANENPMGLSKAAREAVIKAISLANRYPVGCGEGTAYVMGVMKS